MSLKSQLLHLYAVFHGQHLRSNVLIFCSLLFLFVKSVVIKTKYKLGLLYFSVPVNLNHPFHLKLHAHLPTLFVVSEQWRFYHCSSHTPHYSDYSMSNCDICLLELPSCCDFGKFKKLYLPVTSGSCERFHSFNTHCYGSLPFTSTTTHDIKHETSSGQTEVGVPGVRPGSQLFPGVTCGHPCSGGVAEQVQRQRINDAAGASHQVPIKNQRWGYKDLSGAQLGAGT